MSYLLDPGSTAARLLWKTPFPFPVAAELLRRYPDAGPMLALNPYLDSSVFAGVSWPPEAGPATAPLISVVPEDVAVRWIRSSDRRPVSTIAFLDSWVMGSDLQREFLRRRSQTLTWEQRDLIAFRNLFDQEIVFELLTDGSWPLRSLRVAGWLAHNPLMVDDATFVNWICAPQRRDRMPLRSEVLALMQRPHLAGALLDQAGPSAVPTVIEVDTPGNLDRILDLVRAPRLLKPRDQNRALYRLSCHPGLPVELRADLLSVLERKSVRSRSLDHAAADSRHILHSIPSGDPDAYTVSDLRSVVRFYENARDEKALIATKDFGPLLWPVDVLEGLIAAAIRLRDVDSSLGLVLYSYLTRSRATDHTDHSHRLLDLSNTVAVAFPKTVPLPGSGCGTHRVGHVPPPDSVVRSILNQPVKRTVTFNRKWREAGGLPLKAAFYSIQSEVEVANRGKYLTYRLGTAVGDTDKWVAFLHLAGSLDPARTFAEAVDVALAVTPSPASARQAT